jgi:Uma2 family endonuclease
MTLAPASSKRRRSRPQPRDGRTGKVRMTEAEFVRWAFRDEDLLAEWVDGEVIIMPPPSIEHVRLDIWLIRVLGDFVDAHDLGEVLGPEAMVRFAAVPSRRLPDVLFISKNRLGLFKQNHLEGPPDVIFEIVSPESESRDWREKFQEYEKNGVREYWIINPNSQQVEAYALKRKKFRRIEEDDDGVIRSVVIRDFWLKTDWLWSKTRPSVQAAARALGIKR